MTEEEKKRLEEEKAQQEATDRAIAYARSVGYGVEGQQAPATQPEQPVTPDYGLRNDGTKKGKGWLGEIRLPNGNVATEYSVGVGFDGKETEIPTLVPTLTQEEIAQMRDDIIPNNKPVPEGIMNKAIEHARSRMQAGQSVWADETPAVTDTQPQQQPAPATTPTTQPKPQTTQVGSVRDAYTNMYNDTMRTGEDVISAKSDYLRNQADFLRQQNAARQKADDDAWQQVLNGQKTLQQYWIDRDNEAKAEVARAKEEDRQRTEMENRRAGLVGAGEVAASLINLFSVGGLHASNQVYKDYAQDWMRKADMDRKYRQMRIDQLRDRQRGIGDKMEGMRASVTREAYERYRQQAAADAAEAQREAERQREEEAAQAKRDADMQTKGFVPDPNSETGYRFDPNLAREMAFAKSTKTARTTSSTSPASAQKPATTQPTASASGGNDYSSYAVRSSSASSQSSSRPASTSSSSQTRQQSSGSGRRAGRGRTTFLPPTQEDWERGIDLKNSPQGRKKIEPENKDDWSQYKVK